LSCFLREKPNTPAKAGATKNSAAGSGVGVTFVKLTPNGLREAKKFSPIVMNKPHCEKGKRRSHPKPQRRNVKAQMMGDRLTYQ